MTTNNEVWKDVVGYEGLYLVSNYGRIKSLEKIRVIGNGAKRIYDEKILKLYQDSKGYQQCKLCKDGKCKSHLVHRLVNTAFTPNPLLYKEVNHKDENKTNNELSNLEWCDKCYNMNYGNNHKLGHIKRAKTTSKKVLQYDLNMNLLKVWDSASECGRNGYSQGSISNCCNSIKYFKTYKGYIWRYVNEND